MALVTDWQGRPSVCSFSLEPGDEAKPKGSLIELISYFYKRNGNNPDSPRAAVLVLEDS